MKPLAADVAVLGSGFGGSLTALLTQRMGLKTALIDRAAHPRFAIGESSTPTADFVLEYLAREYDLPELAPLARFGNWQRTYPQLTCGLKRGFSYFLHAPNEPFVPAADHGNELLVAASGSDEVADTHWLRSDVDHFLVQQAQRHGVEYFDRTNMHITRAPHAWELQGTREGQSVRVAARFLIDASGEAAALSGFLKLPSRTSQLATHSRAIFAHFHDIQPWHAFMQQAGGATDDYPFPCDDAAQHHLLQEGWMWQLRFVNGVTSAGVAIDARQYPPTTQQSVDTEWQQLLRRYPSLEEQFAAAHPVAPAGGLVRSGRLQRLAGQFGGEDWAMLPNTAGFIDPLHSTGIAQTLCGIERLLLILRNHWGKDSMPAALRAYEQTLLSEFTFVDRIVDGGYQARRSMRLFTAFAMVYFAAATTYEWQRREGQLASGAAFLCADNAMLCTTAQQLRIYLQELLEKPNCRTADLAEYEHRACEALRPFNHVGLFDPPKPNMYWHTAAKGQAPGARLQAPGLRL